MKHLTLGHSDCGGVKVALNLENKPHYFDEWVAPVRAISTSNWQLFAGFGSDTTRKVTELGSLKFNFRKGLANRSVHGLGLMRLRRCQWSLMQCKTGVLRWLDCFTTSALDILGELEHCWELRGFADVDCMDRICRSFVGSFVSLLELSFLPMYSNALFVCTSSLDLIILVSPICSDVQ
jgi:hypothetical protein